MFFYLGFKAKLQESFHRITRRIVKIRQEKESPGGGHGLGKAQGPARF